MAQMTLRLSDDHERMLEDMQRRNPGVSRQKLFERMLEATTHEQVESIDSLIDRIENSNPALWEALRGR